MFSNKDLRKLIIPLVIEQFLVISLGMIDTVMVSAVGEAAESGVSIVDMLNVLVIDVFAGLATGGAVVVSHYLGAKNKEVASKTGSQLISVCALFGAAVFIIVMVFRTQIMNLLSASRPAVKQFLFSIFSRFFQAFFFLPFSMLVSAFTITL